MAVENGIFTCIGRGHGAPALPANREAWEAMRREKWLEEMCRRIEAGDEKLKRRLPVWTPHCAAFKDNHRAIADALTPLNRLMLDFDEKGHSAEILEKSLALQEAGKWQVLLVEESVRRGTHVLIVLPEGMSPEKAQRQFSDDVGFEADGAVKDVARCIYLVPEANTLYVNEALFVPQEATPVKEEAAATEAATVVEADFPTTYKGIAYTDIIREWFNRMGGDPQPGERNEKLYRLATQLRYITDNDPELLVHLLPKFGLEEEEIRRIVHSACKSKYYRLPKPLKEIIDQLQGTAPIVSQPPPMPKRLPPLIKLLVSRTPDIYKAAVAHAVFPSLGIHLHRVKFRYIDNVLHEATLMNVLMAETGAGKDCISEPINRILSDVRQRDAVNLQRERAWKKEVNSKGANKDKRERPEGLVIQEIDADMTNPAFVMRMAEADGHFLYTRMNEIEQFDALRGSGKTGQQFQIMCLAFDPGNRYGQTRVGIQSVTEKVTIRFNWNASTTIQKGRKYFARVLTDGPISRINFCTIPQREIGSEMPVYGTYDAAFDEELRPYIERLTQASGEVDCPQAFRLAKKLKEENAEFARLSQSRVFENLSFRANVIAYLKACVLYVAHDGKWDKTLEEFVRWSLQYDLWCKMQFFGEMIGKASEDEYERTSPGPQNLLDLLPDTFSRAEVLQLRLGMGMKADAGSMLAQWKHRGYILQMTNDSYQKSDKYKKND